MLHKAKVNVSGQIAQVRARCFRGGGGGAGAGDVTAGEDGLDGSATCAPAPAEVTAAVESLEEAVRRLDGLAESLRPQIEREIAGLAIAIARKIVATEIPAGNYQIGEIVDRLMQQLPGAREVVLRLNPDDLSVFRDAWSNSRELAERLDAMRVVGDPSVGRAECIVETPAGVAELAAEKQLDDVEEGFLHGA